MSIQLKRVIWELFFGYLFMNRLWLTEFMFFVRLGDYQNRYQSDRSHWHAYFVPPIKISVETHMIVQQYFSHFNLLIATSLLQPFQLDTYCLLAILTNELFRCNIPPGAISTFLISITLMIVFFSPVPRVKSFVYDILHCSLYHRR